MKKVLILYSDSDIIKDSSKRKNYELLYEMGAQKGIKFYRAHIKYSSGGIFKKAFTYKNKKWIEENNIYPDIVFDLCVYSGSKYNKEKKQIAESITMVNDLFFNYIFVSKFLTYTMLSDFMPKTFLAYNKKDLITKIDLIKSKKIVLKPDVGFGGKDVIVIEKKEIKNILNKNKINCYPIVIQEFIDSSSGIKKIAKSFHDLRIIFIGHKPIIIYLREPIGKSLISNVSLGGKRTMIDLDMIPVKLQKKIDLILNKLKIFENVIYSIDFIFDKDQNPYVLEINSPPSLHLEDKKYLKIYYKEIIKHFKEIN
ncbi:MAG: ATP-grasp domain-containing protein [Candidatus Pacebacteria bacterium]|nr:ATP-grasp domain-containing protein [Candidatus Paceibacterota bacterium]